MPTIKPKLLLTIFLFPLFLSTNAGAAVSPITTSIEPIIGYERITKPTPTIHSKDRLIYGARLTVGLIFFSAEAEYLHGTDSEVYPLTSTTIKDTTDKFRLGLRSSIPIIGLASFTLRAGGQASLNQHETTIAGFTAKTIDPIQYHPYAGAGFRLRLQSNFSLTADLTTVFTDFPNMDHNEYQLTTGIALNFP